MCAYKKLSAERLKRLKSVKHKKYREKYGIYLIEGEKTIREALSCSAPVDCIVSAEFGRWASVKAAKSGIHVFCADMPVLRALSDTKNPPPDLAYVKIERQTVDCTIGLFVALDGVADPYNVGTIIRTADALGVSGVLISHDSCDIYNPKVQRAAMGSMFHIPTEQCALNERLLCFKSHGCRVIATSPHVGCENTNMSGAAVLVIGSEACGVRPEIFNIADGLFKINMDGRAESLNAAVAAGIAIYAVKQNMHLTDSFLCEEE